MLAGEDPASVGKELGVGLDPPGEAREVSCELDIFHSHPPPVFS